MAYAVAELIKQINDELEKNANNAMRPMGITMAQLGMLVHLHEGGGQLSMKQLESRIRVAQSTTVGIESRLEAKGLVESFISDKDHRVKIVRITKAGEEMYAAARQNMDEAETRLVRSLSEEERDTLIRLLLKMRDDLK
ncbi:MAG: MarR family winged helix-turn-helix transcriptional regulator [Anaerovoracaceae bacterium]|jgi:DNA-binding MarR family transcriptional regulator